MEKPLLRTENIQKWYGSVYALKGVDLEVQKGECVGLIGDNGAGKSTLIKIIGGYIQKDSGSIYWKGRKVEIPSVLAARKLGIETVHQTQSVVPQLSVAENIFLAREPVKKFGPIKIIDYKKMRELSFNIMRSLKLNISPNREVDFCSGGERQGVAIARVMYFKAELLLMDEPTTALAAGGVKKILEFVKNIKKQGVSIIYISHNLRHVLEVSDRIYIMSHGQVKCVVNREGATEEKLLELQLEA